MCYEGDVYSDESARYSYGETVAARIIAIHVGEGTGIKSWILRWREMQSAIERES